MTEPAPAPLPRPATIDVVARGLVRGREVDGGARLELGEVLSIASHDGAPPLRIGPRDLDGVEAYSRGATLVLYLRGGDALELEGGAALVGAVECWATRLPELTRDLRALGTRRVAGDEHDRFFGPLLDARRRAERGAGWEAQRAAFEPVALRRALEGSVTAFAASRHPDSAPDRRALEAELEEYLACVVAALAVVEEAGARMTGAEARARLAAWRDWAAAVRRVFVEADRCWLDARVALAAVEPPATSAASVKASPGFVRRLFGRGGRRR